MADTRPDAANSRPPVIRAHVSPGAESAPDQWKILVACLGSVLTNGLLIGVLFLVPSSRAGDSAPKEVVVIDTKVEDQSKPPDLENDEIGLDPEVPTAYNVDRIEPVAVPGTVHKDEPVGIPGADDGPPVTLPPPPGMGNTGSGAGVDSLLEGHAPNIGDMGGYGGKMIPGGFTGRSAATREKLEIEGGGNTKSRAAVAAGIKWLVNHQSPDGHWSLNHYERFGHCNCKGKGQDNDVAATAFGLLPLLGAGETPRKGAYAKNVDRGLKYLMAKQNREGDFGGGMYAHGLATIAMCEAYGMTGDPILKRPAQYAVNFILRAQNTNGGWDYSPNPNGTRTDTSVGGWQLMALQSGRMGGLEVPSKSMVMADKWLDRVSSANGSGYGYDAPGPTPTMTAVGLLSREYRGWGPRNPALIKGVNNLVKDYPPGKFQSMYYYYYATQVMHHFGGQPWKEWNLGKAGDHPGIRDLLIQTQDRGNKRGFAHQKGSWGPEGDALGGAGGRIMMTSMATLTLEVYYRHLPLYRRGNEMGENKQ
jgi:hypothetical protein